MRNVKQVCSDVGESKLLRACTLPLTVDRTISNLGVLDVVPGGLRIVETAPGVSEEDIRGVTEAKII